MLPGEACRRAILVDGGGAHGERPAERLDSLRDLADRGASRRGDRLDDGAGKRDTGRDRKAVADRLPEPDRLRAEDRVVVCLLERDNLLHTSTVTSPASPSTRTRTPSAIRSVASRVPTTPGNAVFARDDRRMGKQAPAVGHDRAEQRQKDVERLARRFGDEDVALDDPVELGGTGDAARRPLVDAPTRRQAAQRVCLRAAPRRCRTPTRVQCRPRS